MGSVPDPKVVLDNFVGKWSSW